MHRTQPMPVQYQRQRAWALWLALLLAAFAALAPTVSHALNWARGGHAGMIEVCTSSGPRWMALSQVMAQVDADSSDSASSRPVASPDAPVSGQFLEHCPFCLLLAERAALPSATWPLDFALPGHALAPPDLPQFFLPAFTAPAPPPRGPPTSF